jgi:predicted  nucleic acid-binding Zn-ribbon protein
MGPHDEFLELCAVSTSGDLTEEEQTKLQVHLAGCSDCRRAMKEFQAAVDVGVPFLASKLTTLSTELPESSQAEPIRPELSQITISEEPNRKVGPWNSEGKRGFAFSSANGHARNPVNWNHVWMPFAACVLLTIALGIYAYRAGENHNAAIGRTTSVPMDTDGRLEALEQGISDAGHEREVLKSQLVERDKVIGDLRRQTEEQSRSLEAMKSAQTNLERSIREDDAGKQQLVDERTSLAQKLDAAQSSLQKIESELNLAKQQRVRDEAEDASLENQIKDLSGQLQEQRQTVAKQDDLLSHDRDIRELMGARDLYVAEVYDVKRDGSTQKSYGRVFYTKGKSLIFYAYDLNEEPGAKNASTFQAWGRRGPDKQQALNLGIFYEDSAVKKRWVLKFDNPQALSEIDAVFVTVEPQGGSTKPSSKPLLYAYLQLPPNHP